MKLTKLLCSILVAGLILGSCKSKKGDEDIITPAPELYSNGLNLLQRNKYTGAAEEFGKIFFQHPGNPLTPQAELMQAYSLFLAGEYEEAIDVIEMFIKLHPMNEDISYAYYLRGLSYYMQISYVRLDQSRTAAAKEAFEELIRRFPASKYAIDAALKIDLVNDHLAGQEMSIGLFYLRKNNPIAAIRRFEEIVNHYQTTSHTPEALYRIVESYMLLGLPKEAKKYAAILGYNYPQSGWYKYSYELIQRAN